MGTDRTAPEALEHVDVLIVGAGLSGIGAACHLLRECPTKSFAIVEAREAIGGTWDLFRYPGVRSDSDMFTLGYSFKPWEQPKAIADGPAIREYIIETAREHGLLERVRFGHRVVRADWSSSSALWTVQIARAGGPRLEMTCRFLFGCTGYYRYDQGYAPRFAGSERFAGRIVHPQHWPADLDYAGKRVIVIGSGATAVTLVPAMAERAAHVTMLQRSPTYIVSLPSRDGAADLARRILPRRSAYALVRWKNVLRTQAFFELSRRAPRLVRSLIRRGVERHLPAGYDVDTHFNPRYNPWDQRVCLVPDNDLFDALANGSASVVTDDIVRFAEHGIELASGQVLEADVIVTATGLNLQVLGGMSLRVDGHEVALSETVGYKGMMLSGVPNLALTLGYTNASWTLKCDLIGEYVCRLLNHMDRHGYVEVRPRRPGASVSTEPFLDLKSGYVLRSVDELPKQGSRTPWRLNQNYPLDVRLLRHGRLDDEGVEFSRMGPRAHGGSQLLREKPEPAGSVLNAAR
jgi:monooxygenase